MKAIDRRSGEPIAVAYRAPVVISDVGAPLTYRAAAADRRRDRTAHRQTARRRRRAEGRPVGGQSLPPPEGAGLDARRRGRELLDQHLARSRRHRRARPRRRSPASRAMSIFRFHRRSRATTGSTPPRSSPSCAPTRSTPGAARRMGPRARLRRTQAAHRRRAVARSPTRAVPGLSALVAYSELSTPLTIEHFTSHPARRFLRPAGNAASATVLAARRAHADSRPLSQPARDAASLGVPGALMGGLAAASQVLGPAGFLRIMASGPTGAEAAAARRRRRARRRRIARRSSPRLR